MRERFPLNDGWFFTDRFDSGFLSGALPGEPVELPHTCKVTPLHYFDESVYQMVCGYRRVISVPESWANKRIFVVFGAVAHRATVYADGKKIASHACGYTAFEVELTPFAVPGKDLVLTVECDTNETLDQPPFGFVIDYMTFGGICREVTLELRENTYINDLFVRADIPENSAVLKGGESGAEIGAITFRGDLHVRLGTVGQDADALRLRVFDKQSGKLLAEETRAPANESSLSLPDARLWDVFSPALFVLEAALLKNGGELDVKSTTFSFRRARFEADGFYLNGRKLRIRGLNRHQSYPYFGYAVPASQQRLDADILKFELGVNAVRTSHYPQSQHFVDRCDEIGLLVFTEIPGWQHIGKEDWQKQAIENVAEMVTQYRNHPSIILWGVRINESQDNDDLYAKTNALAHQLDPSRQTGGVRYLKKSRLLEDVYTYNDFVHSGGNKGCEKKKKVTPDLSKGYLVTEYGGHMFPTKSFDDEAHRLEHALRHAAVLDAVAGEKDIAGSFGWCMFDYNTHKDFGSGDRVCYHGVLDMFRNPKMAAAVYTACGDADPAASPFLEVSGSMDIGEHPGGFRGKLFAFTNADAVDVYKNDRFIRRYDHSDSPYKNLPNAPIDIDDLIGEQIEDEGFKPKQTALVRDALNLYARCRGKNLPLRFYRKLLFAKLRWRMNFSRAYALYGKYLGNWGEKSVVYRFDAIKNGKVVRSVEKAPMTSAHLEVLPDRSNVTFDETYEMVLLRIRVRDERGNILPFYMGEASVSISGPLTLAGPRSCPVIGGMGGGYLRTVGKSGAASVTVSLPDMPPVTLEFNVLAHPSRENV